MCYKAIDTILGYDHFRTTSSNTSRWLNLTFTKMYTLTRGKLMNTFDVSDAVNDIRVSFSDGSNMNVSIFKLILSMFISDKMKTIPQVIAIRI